MSEELNGSSARIVSRFADFSPAQWYGMKMVSGRMVVTTFASSVTSPRRLVTVIQAPSAMPYCAASVG